MKNTNNSLISIGETAKLLGVDIQTLRAWDKNGKLKAERTPTGHSFYEFKRQLIYKANQWGKAVKSVDIFYPSTKTCHCCGHKVDELPLSVRMWQCPSCHTQHDRDINASMNILANANNLLTA